MNEVKVEMRDQLLERSRTVKCLGVFLDVGLTLNDHIEYVRKKMLCGAREVEEMEWSAAV